MKHKKLNLCVAFLFAIGQLTAFSQESINSGGGNGTGTGGTTSFSIGQISYHTWSAGNGSLAEGVQQPFEISQITGLIEPENVNLSISTFPNPTSDFLEINIGPQLETSLLEGTVSYQLIDIQGRIMTKETLNVRQSKISMYEYPSGIYFLKITIGSKAEKTFKIIKR